MPLQGKNRNSVPVCSRYGQARSEIWDLSAPARSSAKSWKSSPPTCSTEDHQTRQQDDEHCILPTWMHIPPFAATPRWRPGRSIHVEHK